MTTKRKMELQFLLDKEYLKERILGFISKDRIDPYFLLKTYELLFKQDNVADRVREYLTIKETDKNKDQSEA
jgi:hypothetical protein